MKSTIFFLATVILPTLLLWGCQTTNPEIIEVPEVSGQIVFDSGCKDFSNSNDLKTASQVSPAQSCIDYTFDSQTRILSLKHINAGFNCCPGSLFCQVNVNGDTLVIREFENSAMCRCNCLYDLDIEIKGLEIKSYQIKVIEPYAQNQEEIAFGLDLTSQSNGSFCVDRTHYPWGVY